SNGTSRLRQEISQRKVVIEELRLFYSQLDGCQRAIGQPAQPLHAGQCYSGRNALIELEPYDV
ncbi:hypothetical protein, partial [Natrialba sp. PRR66]|uniref:hypothetical protein n=1 Tax=Natrialba sp. PRR66 TaxID=3098146 RepID=UPI002B1DCEC4